MRNNNTSRRNGDVIIRKRIEKGHKTTTTTICSDGSSIPTKRGETYVCMRFFFLLTTQIINNTNALNATNRGTSNEFIYRKKIEKIECHFY